jgi:hypothetical protein
LYCDNIPINNMNNQVAQPLVWGIIFG